MLGVAALVLLVVGTAGLAAPLVMLGVALFAPGIARHVGLRLLRAPQRVRARQALIDAEAAKAFGKLFRRGNSQPKLVRKVPSTLPAAERFTVVPTAVYSVSPGDYSRTCRKLSWTGTTLTVTDRRGNAMRWRTVSGGVLRGTRLRSQGPAPELGDLLVAELAVTKPRLLPLDRIHLLDRWSRRLATVPVLGFTEEALAALAAHAGVAFTLYEIPSRVKATPETLVGALFPRSVRYCRPSGVGPELRWLERVRLIKRAIAGLAEETLYDPQADMAARRAARNRR